MSGNLSYSLPLLAIKSRGLSIPLHAVYNSQSWATSGSTAVPLMAQGAVGAAWQMHLGAILPQLDKSGAVQGYSYITSSGAIVPLLKTPQGWIGINGSYVRWMPGPNLLYHPNGTTFTFGAQAASAEPDAGALYPTLIQCRNGNQITVTYLPGIGEHTSNTSSRISSIADARAPLSQDGQNSYLFQYSSDAAPHLLQIKSLLPTDESYTFEYAQQVLANPAANGKDSTSYPVLTGAAKLSGATRAFSYNGYGEMLSASNWHGGLLEWEYSSVSLPNGELAREVSSRTLSDPTSSGNGSFTVTFDRPGDEPVGSIHSTARISNGAQPLLAYTFNNRSNASLQGLLLTLQTYGDGGQVIQSNDYGWQITSYGSPYRASRMRTLDPGSASQKSSRWEMTQDDFHNPIEIREFGYRSAATPISVQTKTYLQTAEYVQQGIVDLVSTVSMQRTGQTSTQRYAYDSKPVSSASGVSFHDAQAHGVSQQVRGNQTEIVTSGFTRQLGYDETGILNSIQDSRGYEASFAVAPNTNGTEHGAVYVGGTLVSKVTFTYGITPVHTATSANGSVVTSKHDVFGRPVSATSSTGLTSSRTYTVSPTAVSINIGQLLIRTTIDGFGRTVKVEKGSGSETNSIQLNEYNAAGGHPVGKLSRTSEPFAPGATPRWSHRVRDAAGRVTAHVLPDGNKHTVQRSGSSLTATSAAGTWKKLTYDAEGNLETVQTQDPNSSGAITTNYSYDSPGKLAQVQMSRPTGTQQRSYTYDSNGRIVRRQEPESGQRAYTYNPDGTLAVMQDANGQQHTYTRDKQKRITRVQRSNAAGVVQPQESYSYTYDTNPIDSSFTENGIGQITTVQWGDPSTLPGQFTEMYSYTPNGVVSKSRLRMTRGQHSTDLDLEIGFDSDGRVSSLLYPGSSQALTYTYDSQGQPLSVSFANGDAVVSDASYDILGRLETMRTLVSKSDGYVTESRAYTASGKLASLAVTQGGNVDNVSNAVLSKQYSYDAATSKLVTEQDLIAGDSVSYAYDVAGRLVMAATASDAWGLAFAYDDFDNRTTQKITKGQAFDATAAYSPETNWLLSGEVLYDKNGNMLSLPDLALQYDTLNRLTAAKHTLKGIELYGYNPAGLRIWQKSASREIVSFYHGGSRIMSLNVATASDGSFSLTPRDANIFFGRRVVRKGTSALTSDDRNSVRLVTNRTSPISRSFLPFGEEFEKTPDDTVKFGGYVRDSATGLDYAGQRYYSSSLGRFITPDPDANSANIRQPQSWNRYAFVLNDPINHVDPNGLANSQPLPGPGPTTPQVTSATFTDGSNSSTTVTMDPNNPGHGTIVTSTISFSTGDGNGDDGGQGFGYNGPGTNNPSSTDLGNDLMALGAGAGAAGQGIGGVLKVLQNYGVVQSTPTAIAEELGEAEVAGEITGVAVAAGVASTLTGIGIVIVLVGVGVYAYERSQQH